ncbi:dual specificity protein kinase yak1 [Coemansia aciculifera]|uniref:Dual specificity protein kinase yak1 n=1 Tax=Coemansia aciculifera TaxID=417176 RepID=A0A9W8ISG1_9FUNG|nr:dual specificity protein kinase yak1 [Coemansia aciculifera]
MAHNNSNGRNGNVPLGSLPSPGNQYIYNSYIDPARLDGAAPASPSAIVFMAQTPAASGNSAVAISLGGDSRTQNAPNTAASDRSFHAIMIGDNGAQTPARQSSLAAAAGSSHVPMPGLHPRPKQSFDMGNMPDMQGGSSLSASLPSGNPFLHSSGSTRDPVAPGTEHRMASATHARIAYPPLNIVSGDEWAAALPSPGISQHQHTRADSQQYAPLSSHAHHQQQHFTEHAQATGANNYCSSAIHNSGDHTPQRWPQVDASSVYQAVTIGDVSRPDIDVDYAQQHYPVSHSGLPPLGPASASLSAYAAAANHSPLVARGRSRRRPHPPYDYPDSNATGTYSSESSPAPVSTLPPGVRQTLSTSSFAESATGMADSRTLGRRGSELNVSMHSMRDSETSSRGASHGHSPAAALAIPTGGAISATRATPTYNYPEVAYSRPGDAPHQEQTLREYTSGQTSSQGRGRPESTMMASTSDRSESRMTEVAPIGEYAAGPDNFSMTSAGRYLQPHTQYGSASVEGQYQEYANAMSSMAQTRWSQGGAVASPLRTELSVSNAVARDLTAPADLPPYTHDQQAAQQYATMPRSGYAAHGAVRHSGSHSGERGHIPPAIATSVAANSISLLQAWPPASPQIRTTNNSSNRGNHQPSTATHVSHGYGSPALQTSGRTHNAESSPDHGQAAQGAPNILSNYYMVTSPNGQLISEPQTPVIDSTSLLPMVEVGQGGIRPAPVSDMDEINAHSQEYLHRRRRRLTQTLHNRQRSGSAVDVASRLSATRLNALPLSSPGANSHTSNRSMEEVQSVDSEQQAVGRQRYQPPPVPPSSAAYAGASMGNLQDELYSAAVMQAQAQAQAHAQAQAQAQALAHIQAQAQAQAEYLQRLQLERVQQERIQLERIRQEHMQATAHEQQRQKSKLAQEQELARFSEYRPLLNLTVYIAETYRKCHVDFSYDSARRPRRVLTDPSEGVENDGFDNKNSDYILYVNDVIGEKDGHQFLILEMLGSGTFGQVVKCQNTKTGELVAVKVIKNKPAYYKQSMMEVQMLSLLNNKYDIDDRHHILRLKESFVFRNHLVFVNELLSINLYDLLKQNQYQGLSTNLVRVLVQQILDAMIVLKQAEIIHADLKPENILLEDMEKPVVKVIDFGSACFEWQTSFTYIQSRFYRSPEILLGLPYSSRIDMWSLGCIVAELYLGLPLFPGSSEYNQLSRIIDLLGLPPTNMLERARRTDEFFNYLGPSTWDLKSMVQYAREHNAEEKQSKRYFNATTLEELITTYPLRRRMSEAEQQREYQSRFALIDFLRGLLHLDPDKRWSPQQAAMHPFITGEPSVGTFVPPSLAGGGSHGPGSGSRPYDDPANNSSSHHGLGHSASGGGGYAMQGGNNSGYGSLHALGGYPAHHGSGSGANGHSAYLMQNSAAGSSGPSSIYGQATSQDPTSYATNVSNPPMGSSATSSYLQSFQQPNYHMGLAAVDDSPRIPGSFPLSGGSSGAQPLLASPQLARQESNGRLRATTIGHHSAGATQPQEMSTQAHQYATVGHNGLYGQQYPNPNPNQRNSVDPSSSHLSDLLIASSDSRGAPGRLDTSQSNSEYSAESSYGWTTRSEVNHINGYGSSAAPSVTGSYGTRPGSLHEFKATGSTLQRHFLLNERQQQRLVQQRQLVRADLGEPTAQVGHYGGGTDLAQLSRVGGRNSYCGSLAGGKSNSSADRYASTSSVISSRASERSGAGNGLFCVSEQHQAGNRPSPALRSSAGVRLVSNFSPLTVPSTPGSLGSSQQHGVGSVDTKLNLGSWGYPQGNRVVGPPECCNDSDGSFDEGSGDDVSDVDDANSRYSVGSGISRPLTQAHFSEESLSMYSAASGQDDCSGHGNGGRRSGGSNGSWTDGLSSWGSEGSGSRDFFETPMSVSQTHTVRGSLDEPPQPALQVQSLGRTIWASLGNGIGGTGASSIYQLPRYAAYSQEVLGRSDSAFCAHDRASPSGEFVEFIEGDKDDSPSAESVADSSWVFDDYEAANDVDEGSVISQEDLNEYDQETLPQDDLEETASLLGGLEMNQSLSDSHASIGSVEGSDSETAAKESDEYGERASDEDSNDGGSSDCDDMSDEDDEDDDATDQDIVLFAGKLHPVQGARTSSIATATPAGHQRRLSNANALSASAAVSLDSQRTTLLPLSRSSRCGSFASHPQRIAKKTHLRRSDRQPPSALLAPPLLLLKDSLRMVESLRRMGKWQDSADLAQDVAHINRANQFYLDPVIIAMSPRLMPPSGQQG